MTVMSGINVTREQDGNSGRYVAVVDGLESELTYTRVERAGVSLIIADHTGVPRPVSGRGIGLALVRRAVEDARAEGAKVVPLCSFVRVHMERNKDWRDLIAD
jgi:predicted GNAT family acetyltransferase